LKSETHASYLNMCNSLHTDFFQAYLFQWRKGCGPNDRALGLLLTHVMKHYSWECSVRNFEHYSYHIL